MCRAMHCIYIYINIYKYTYEYKHIHGFVLDVFCWCFLYLLPCASSPFGDLLELFFWAVEEADRSDVMQNLWQNCLDLPPTR